MILVNAWVCEVSATAPAIVSNHALADLLLCAHHTPHTHLLHQAKEILRGAARHKHTTQAS
jgi:hypothetical protein